MCARYRGLTDEEGIVFGYIESAGREGIWTRTIRSKSNLHQNVFNRCLKSLESKGLVKTTTSSKFPTRKLYILSHLQPLEEVSGGPFYTDGVIDEEYVHHLCLWIEDYVRGRSWHFSAKTTPRKRKADISKSKDAAMLKMEDSKSALKERGKRWLPMPAGYIGYPKVPEITRAVNDKGLSSVTMKEAEVRQLLDLLCWDGRLMKVMGGQAYKSVHNTAPAHDEMRNGLVESPCGRCPVFDLCEEGGPVNARTCTYFQDWLQI
jgi:DNA-directed RNA polymerase III subunit RPC6